MIRNFPKAFEGYHVNDKPACFWNFCLNQLGSIRHFFFSLKLNQK